MEIKTKPQKIKTKIQCVGSHHIQDLTDKRQ